MARPYRLQAENCFYHITSRGDNCKKIFISTYDFEKFLEYLLIAKDKYQFNLYAYCLMSNHYHLFLEILQPNLSRIMQYVNTSYTTYYNKKRNKTGHLFQGRFKSLLVDEDSYFLKLTRYIHLNPVKAKMVDSPEKYRWSSFKGYTKLGYDKYIDYPELNRYLNMKPAAYKKFILSSIGKKDTFMDNIYAGSFLGGKKFILDKLKDFKPEIESGDFAHKKILCYVDFSEIILAIAKVYKTEPDKLFKAVKKPLLAKKVAVYLLKRHSGLTNKAIGDIFGISYSAVSKIDKSMQIIIAKEKRVKKDVDKLISHFKV
ncbi:MAG: hypothetical protein GY858_01990 [Candidatus Omnitrophica bacterium]|nr:hypothetical protein [Candidatus Omnitrophota bacterium]